MGEKRDSAHGGTPDEREERDEVQVQATAEPEAAGVQVDEAGPATIDGGSGAPEGQTDQEQRAVEHCSLARVFDLVRVRSADGQLVTPDDWTASDIVPSHMDDESFEMFLYDFLEEQKAEAAEAHLETAQTPAYRSAMRTVGIPRMFVDTADDADVSNGFVGSGDGIESSSDETERLIGTEEAPLVEEAEATKAADIISPEADLLPGFEIPEGFELIELEGELTLVPIEESEGDGLLTCDDIAILVGNRSYYLYSSAIMTDTYAHWAFLAREDDRIITFVDCVRTESRTYPRPMAASGLKNEPFNMTDDEIEQTWNALHESGEYPDIETTTASNGEIYYYSTEHLSSAYASSLAEWHAVERAMYL